MRLHLHFLLSIILLAGCTAQGPVYQASGPIASNEAELIIYRKRLFAGSGTYPVIMAGDRIIGELRQGGFLRVRLPPGRTTLTTAGNFMFWPWKSDPLQVNLMPGAIHYVELDPMARSTARLVKCGETDERIMVCERKTPQPGLILQTEELAMKSLFNLMEIQGEDDE
jgi:hypothetical protein